MGHDRTVRGRAGSAWSRAGRSSDELEFPSRREPDRGSRVREAEIGEQWPDLPDWAVSWELDADVQRDLRGLSKENAEFVGAHLVAAGTLADDEPELAWRHARAARSKGGRIAVVRETVGLVAYRAGQWSEAIGELRAARRMGGGAGHLAVMADCERALGAPQRAIELARSAEVAELDEAAAVELRIVVAGARADLGEVDAALAYLEGSGLRTAGVQPYSARLYYAYADLLVQAGRFTEGLEWFMKAADVDVDDETDAGDRAAATAELIEPQRAQPPQAEPQLIEPPQAEPPQAEPPQAEPPQTDPILEPTDRAVPDGSAVDPAGTDQHIAPPIGSGSLFSHSPESGS